MWLFLLFLFLCLGGQTFTQYYYLPSTTLGNPGGLNTDNEYPSGSGLDASWEVLLGGGNSTPTWSPIDTIPFTFNFNGSTVSTFKVSTTGVLTFTTSSTNVPVVANAPIPDPGTPEALALFNQPPTFAERQWAARSAGLSRPDDALRPTVSAARGLVQISEPREREPLSK